MNANAAMSTQTKTEDQPDAADAVVGEGDAAEGWGGGETADPADGNTAAPVDAHAAATADATADRAADTDDATDAADAAESELTGLPSVVDDSGTDAAGDGVSGVREKELEPANSTPVPDPAVGADPGAGAAATAAATPPPASPSAPSPTVVPEPRATADPDADADRGKSKKARKPVRSRGAASATTTTGGTKSLVVWQQGKVHYTDDSVLVLDLDEAASPDLDVHDLVDRLTELREALDSPGRSEAVAALVEIIQERALN